VLDDTPGTLDLGLVLTHACNLACVYCYTGEKKRVHMSREVAWRSLDAAFDHLAALPRPHPPVLQRSRISRSTSERYGAFARS
jgi:hypothetical protein